MATDVVLFALEREARLFRRLRPDVRVCITGVGTAPARSALQTVLNSRGDAIERLILAGFGGALTRDARIGDVIVASEVVDEAGGRWPCSWDGNGRILTVNRVIATIEEKLSLGQRHQAEVCDMESSAVAELCHARGIEFIAVRAISDTAEHELSPTVNRLIVNGQISTQAALQAMTRKPRLAGEFYRLARDTRRAARSLARAVAAMIPPVNQ